MYIDKDEINNLLTPDQYEDLRERNEWDNFYNALEGVIDLFPRTVGPTWWSARKNLDKYYQTKNYYNLEE